MNGTKRNVIPILKSFGLMNGASFLVVGTSNSDSSKELYDYLKDAGVYVDNKPREISYDFIYVSAEYNSLELVIKLVSKLKHGGLMLLEYSNDWYNLEVVTLDRDLKVLKINKKLGLLKG